MTSSATSRLDALRRPTDERMIAGVASGIARELDIDPVIVRIGFAVLTFVGFAGPLLYAAGWLLVPSQGQERSPLGEALGVDADGQLRAIGLLAAAVLAVIAIVGDTAWSPGAWFWGPMWALLWIAVPVGAVYWFIVVRPRRAAPTVVAPPPYEPPGSSTVAFAAPTSESASATVTDPVEESVTDVSDAAEETLVLGDGDGPPLVPPTSPVPPAAAQPARERWSPALLLLTLSTIVAAMGALALWSILNEPLDAAVYPAVALGIVVAGLLVGTKFGHPGALVVLGVLLTPVLAVAALVPNLTGGNVDLRPANAWTIAEPVEQGFGRVHIDLTAIDDPDTLAGRTLQIANGLGDTTVIVPHDLDVAVDAALSVAGRIEVFGRVSDGTTPSIDEPADGPGAYRIVISGTAGQIQVVRP